MKTLGLIALCVIVLGSSALRYQIRASEAQWPHKIVPVDQMLILMPTFEDREYPNYVTRRELAEWAPHGCVVFRDLDRALWCIDMEKQ